MTLVHIFELAMILYLVAQVMTQSLQGVVQMRYLVMKEEEIHSIPLEMLMPCMVSLVMISYMEVKGLMSYMVAQELIYLRYKKALVK